MDYLYLKNRSDANTAIPTTTVEKLESLDPLTGEVWAEHVEHTQEEVVGLLDTLHRSYLEFSSLDLEERFRILECCIDAFSSSEYYEKMDRYIIRERGGFIFGPGRNPKSKGMAMASMIKETISLARETLQPRQLKTGIEQYDPMGIIFAITPWYVTKQH